MLNKWMGIGRLGGDPEVKYTQGGAAVCSFTMACSEKWKDRSGEKQERTEWVRIVVWEKLAEVCGEYLSKGKQVYIEGKLQTRSWEDKEGVKRYVTEVVARNMIMLGGKGVAKEQEKRELEPKADPRKYSSEDIPF